MRHLIRKQQLLLSIPPGIDAFQVQHEASRCFWEQLLPALERIFNELSAEDEIICLAYLSIDLGWIGDAFLRGGKLDEAVYKRLKDEVELAIRKELKANPKRRRSTGESVLAQWWYYMEHGRLSWNMTGTTGEWYQKVLEIFSADYSAVSELRKALQDNPLLLMRISAQHSDWFLVNLVAVLTSAGQTGLGDAIDQACRINRFLEEKYRQLISGRLEIPSAPDGSPLAIREALQQWAGRMSGFLAASTPEKREYIWRYILVEAATRPASFAMTGGAAILLDWTWGNGRNAASLPGNNPLFIRLLQNLYGDEGQPPATKPDDLRRPAGEDKKPATSPSRENRQPPQPEAEPSPVPAPDTQTPEKGISRDIAGRPSGQKDVDPGLPPAGEEKPAATPPRENRQPPQPEAESSRIPAPDTEAPEKRIYPDIAEKKVVAHKTSDMTSGTEAASRTPPPATAFPETEINSAAHREPIASDRPNSILPAKAEAPGKTPPREVDGTTITGPGPADKDKSDPAPPADKIMPVAPGVEKLLSPEKFLFQAHELTEEGIYIPNAGAILLHPFLSTFFNRLGLWVDKAFIDLPARQRAVVLIHFLATGERTAQEHELVLPKLMSGYSLEMPLPGQIALTEEECSEGIALIENVIRLWEKLQHASVEGLRQGFLRRPGKLFTRNEKLRLQVESSGIDVLLDFLPWNLSIIKLPWLKQILYVEWR